MKKLGNIICVILIIIGAIFSMVYVNYENKDTDMPANGTVKNDEQGNAVVYYNWGLDNEEKQKEQRIIQATTGFFLYSMIIIGSKYFIMLRKNTKEEIKKMEKTDVGEFLS